MKTYTIRKGTVVEGISITDGKINIGEIGRARKLVSVSIPTGAEWGGEWNADSQGKIFSGPFGGSYHINNGYRSVTPEEAGKLIISVPGEKHGPTAVLVMVQDHSGFRGSWSLREQQGITILAEGTCAQGDAGRMGGGPEYLLVVAEGGSALIHRTGRLYGQPSVLKVLNPAGVLTTDLTERL